MAKKSASKKKQPQKETSDSDTTPETTPEIPTPIPLLMNPRLSAQWVDNFKISARTGDVDAMILSGFQQVPGAEERIEVTRIMMSLAHARKVVETMQNVITKHEEVMGSEM